MQWPYVDVRHPSMMDEEEGETSSFWDMCCPANCCSCQCRDSAPSSEDKASLTIEAYQPVVPSKKRFGYPQHDLEIVSISKDVSLFPVVTSQPTSRSGSPDALRQNNGVTGEQQNPPNPLSLPMSKRGPSGRSPLSSPATSVTPATPSLAKPASAPSLTSASTTQYNATLEFNLYYDSHRESLCVHVHRGLYFPPKKGLEVINSYVMAVLTPSMMQTLKTRVILNSRSPAFDQVLEFSGLSLAEYREQTLVLQVFYRDSDDIDSYVSSCFTKLQEINLTESNQLTKRIDEGKDILKLSQVDVLSLKEEIEQLISSGMKHERSELYFTIYYNNHLQKLSVHLEHIGHLPTRVSEQSSNSYVQIYLLSRKFVERDVYTSHVVAQTHQPHFDCMATFSNVSVKELDSQEVVFRIYLKGGEEVEEEEEEEGAWFLGGVVHPLQSVNLYGSTVTAKILPFPEDDSVKEDLQGDLLMTLCHQPEKGKLVVTILEVKLKKVTVHHHESSLNPYVKVYLLNDNDRVSKWKTSIKKDNLNPIYLESSELDLAKVQESKMELQVLVMNSDHFGRNNEVGRVKFGARVSDSPTGQSHWNAALASADKPITAWHPIFPSPSKQHLLGHRSRSSSRSRSRSRSPVFNVLKQAAGLQV